MYAISERAVVRLRKDVSGWPRDTVGTVIGDYGDVVLVEMSNERGEALDFVQVPISQLELER